MAMNITTTHRTHPDRLANATDAEKRKATEQFQVCEFFPVSAFRTYTRLKAVADAYYVLSDVQRRKEYDDLYGSRADRSTDPNASSNFFAQFASAFTGAGASSAAGPPPPSAGAQPDAEGVFANVFEEVRGRSCHRLPQSAESNVILCSS